VFEFITEESITDMI